MGLDLVAKTNISATIPGGELKLYCLCVTERGPVADRALVMAHKPYRNENVV
jgi:hypothetical protein